MTTTTWIPQPSTTRSARLELAASGYAPISLSQMDAVALLDRIDTKFILTHTQLLQALYDLRNEYRMLCIKGQRLNHYRTLYFDTPDFALYNAHVNDRAERYKVRSREYTDTHLSYLEVKHKTSKDRTIKDRIRTERRVVDMTPDMQTWLSGVFPMCSCTLEPKLENTFTRLTLVSRKGCERVTLDVNLTFYTDQHMTQLDGLAIAEVKLDTNAQESPFLINMREQRIQPCGFSKYSMGVAMLYDQVKKNALKPRLLWVEKLMKGSYLQ